MYSIITSVSSASASHRRWLDVRHYAGEVASTTKRGIQAQVNGQLARVGNVKLFEEAGIALPDDVKGRVQALEVQGKTDIVIGLDQEPVGLGRATRAIILPTLAISLGVIVLLIVASLTGLVSINIAIIFHEGSKLLVVANALRLLGFQIRTG